MFEGGNIFTHFFFYIVGVLFGFALCKFGIIGKKKKITKVKKIKGINR